MAAARLFFDVDLGPIRAQLQELFALLAPAPEEVRESFLARLHSSLRVGPVLLEPTSDAPNSLRYAIRCDELGELLAAARAAQGDFANAL